MTPAEVEARLRNWPAMQDGDALSAFVVNRLMLEAADALAAQAAEIERMDERADCLEAELFEAVQVAYRRGATVWAAMNYPKWIDRLEANAAADLARQASAKAE